MVHFGEILKTWSLRSNSVTRQVSFNRTKIGGKCQNQKIQLRHFRWFSNTVHFSFFAEITFNRGCCKIKEGSPVCPPGEDNQYISNDNWSRHVIRCADNLCNNGKGDDTDNGGGSGGGGTGSITVNGRSLAWINRPTFLLTTFLFTCWSFHHQSTAAVAQPLK